MGLADTNLAAMTIKNADVPTPTGAVTQEKTPVVEQKTEEAPRAPQQNLKSFDVIARKEKAILRERQELSAQKQALEMQIKQLQDWKAEQAKLGERKQSYRTNPNLMLEDHGFTYNDLAEWQLNDKTPTPQMLIKQLEEKLAGFENKQQQQRSADEEARKQAQAEHEKNVVQDFREQIGTFVGSKPDVYEYIKVNEAENLVFDTCEEYYNKTGTLLPIKKACDMVEEHLATIVETKLLSTKKLQSKLGTRSPTKSEEVQSQRTLSNNLTTTSSPYTGLSPRTEQERLDRAMAALDKRK